MISKLLTVLGIVVIVGGFLLLKADDETDPGFRYGTGDELELNLVSPAGWTPQAGAAFPLAELAGEERGLGPAGMFDDVVGLDRLNWVAGSTSQSSGASPSAQALADEVESSGTVVESVERSGGSVIQGYAAVELSGLDAVVFEAEYPTGEGERFRFETVTLVTEAGIFSLIAHASRKRFEEVSATLDLTVEQLAETIAE